MKREFKRYPTKSELNIICNEWITNQDARVVSWFTLSESDYNRLLHIANNMAALINDKRVSQVIASIEAHGPSIIHSDNLLVFKKLYDIMYET